MHMDNWPISGDAMNHGILGIMILCIAVVVAGCGEETAVTISYVKPAQFEMPSGVKRIAVATLADNSANEHAGDWGVVAADKLVAELDKVNREFKRYELVDHRNLEQILHRQDIHIMTSDQVAQAGKLADVHAMVYGTVSVIATDEHAVRKVPDLINRGIKEKHYVKRHCLVTVNITMDDVETSKTLRTFTATREMDSDKDSPSALSAIGFSGDNPPPVAQTVNSLIDQCIGEFVRQISPHRVETRQKLQKGKSKLVETANKLAVVGDIDEALELYIEALAIKSDDDGAAFNAGVMYELKQDFAQAEEFYTRAFRLKDRDEYVQARQRVRSVN